MPNSFRRDEITERYTRTDNAQSDALARLRAEAAAQAVLDREAAARDINERWAAAEVARTRPVPQVGAADGARNAMIARHVPRYAPAVEAPVGRAAAVHAAAGPGATSGAAAARNAMLRRAGR